METEPVVQLVHDSLNETIAKKVQAAREELEARNKQQLDDERARDQQRMLNLYQARLEIVAKKRFNIPEIAFSKFTPEELQKIEENILAFVKQNQLWNYVYAGGMFGFLLGAFGLFIGATANAPPIFVVIALGVMACGIAGGAVGANKSEPELFEIAKTLGKLPKPENKKTIEAIKDRKGQ